GHRPRRRRPPSGRGPAQERLHARARSPDPRVAMSTEGQLELAGTERRVFSVANVNRGLARAVDRLPAIRVEGELCEVSRHERWATVFMTLKDPGEEASLRVTMARWACDRL